MTADMTTALEQIESAALRLTCAERAQLAGHLIASLDEGGELSGELSGEMSAEMDEKIEAAWAAEIEQRVNDIERGTVAGIPLEQAIAHARAMLK